MTNAISSLLNILSGIVPFILLLGCVIAVRTTRSVGSRLLLIGQLIAVVSALLSRLALTLSFALISYEGYLLALRMVGVVGNTLFAVGFLLMVLLWKRQIPQASDTPRSQRLLRQILRYGGWGLGIVLMVSVVVVTFMLWPR